jgi:hypothetical protein
LITILAILLVFTPVGISAKIPRLLQGHRTALAE